MALHSDDGTVRTHAAHHRRTRALLIVGALLSPPAPSALAAVTPSFQVLSTPPAWGSNVYAVAVSADGAVVVGRYFLATNDSSCGVFGGCTRTFRWTAATGAVDLGLLDASEADAHGLSADGAVIVGEASASSAYRRAFVWTPATGMQDLGTPVFANDGDHSVSRAFGVSSTGAVIVGEAVQTQTALAAQAFRFTTAAGFGFLNVLPNNLQSEADGVSSDGAVVVGTSYDTNTFLGRAFRWKAGVVQDLGNLGGGESFSSAASSDGSVVVGLSRTRNNFHGFRWTTGGGIQDLGSLGDWAKAEDVSADGTVVVGSATPPPPGGLTMAFRWTASRGIQDLNRVLRSLGVSTGGYQLVFANGVSADGTVIVGMAENLTTHVDVPYRAVVPSPTCARVTCASLGKNCGTIPDGCGTTLGCGACNAPSTCGGGGTPNVCAGGCTPTTCAAQGKTCGAIPDGCGGWLACGTCIAPQICGGTGTPDVCATPPPFASKVTMNPNAVVGGNPSAGTVTLSTPAPAGGALVTLSSSSPPLASVPPNVTVLEGATTAGFTATTTVPAGDAAVFITGCYGRCASETLFISKPAACTPTTCAAQGKNCGTITDGCGGTLGCGTCTAPQTCGGGGGANVCGGSSAVLTLTATGRGGETVSSTPSGLSVPVGTTRSAGFAVGTAVTLGATNGRDVIWSGACSSGGNKTKTCTFTLNANGSETANVQ